MTTELDSPRKFADYLTRNNLLYASVGVLFLVMLIAWLMARSRARRLQKQLDKANDAINNYATGSNMLMPAEGGEGEEKEAPINTLDPEKRADLGRKINQLYGFKELVPQIPVLRGGLDFNVQPLPSMNNRAVWFRAYKPDRTSYVDVIRDPFRIWGANRARVADFDAYYLQLFEGQENSPTQVMYVRAEGDPKSDGDHLRKAIMELLKPATSTTV